ncbi:MAG: DUF2079 domain-containing protein [Actinomycetota bacterium]|nr:DUF2079 domain-containing protein [Actinomycetota bacterium]
MTATASRLAGGERDYGRADLRVSDDRSATGLAQWLPAVLSAVFLAIYATISLARYDRLDVISWDLGIFSQAAQSYAERGYPIVDIKGPGFALLGDHFSPVLALWGPLWAVAPSPVTLLVAQALLVALSVLPIARVAIALLGTAAGSAVAVAYGLSFGLLAAVDFDVHEYAFAAPLLALAGEAYLLRRWRTTCLWAAALVLVKEDLGLTVAAIGIALMLNGARRYGAWLAAFGLAALALTLLVVIPSVSADGAWQYWERLGAGGNASAGIITTLVNLPTTLVSPGVKVQTWLLTLGVTGFLALRSPWVVAVLPTMLWRLGSDYEFYWGTDLHYSLVPMPIVFVAMVDAIVRSRDGRWGWPRRLVRHVPAVALAVAVVVSLQGPAGDLLSPASYADTARERDADRLLSTLADGSSVETDIGLLAPLVADHDVYFTGTNEGAGSVAVDYAVVDATSGWDGRTDLVQWAQQRHPGARYEQLPDVGRYLVARRVR